MVGHRKEEEKFKTEIRKVKSIWKNLTEGWFGYIFYAILGIVLALILNQTLAFALSTDLPIVAVVTSSMQHDDPNVIEINHYKWLEEKFGYNRSYIDSWPLPNGFSVGDLPIVQGAEEYEVGDVIVYSIPEQSVPIIHRIIRKNPDGSFMTKGDRNPDLLSFEYSVKKEQIHGKVIFVIPKLGYFRVAISKIFGV